MENIIVLLSLVMIFCVIFGIYKIIISIRNDSLNSEEFEAFATVIKKEKEEDRVGFVYIGEIMIPKLKEGQCKLYIEYKDRECKWIKIYNNAKLFNQLKEGDLVPISLTKTRTKEGNIKKVNFKINQKNLL